MGGTNCNCKNCICETVCKYANEEFCKGTMVKDLITECKDFKDKSMFFETSGSHEAGDICIYSFGDKNKSVAIVQIVEILNDERGVAKIRFLKVIVDDTGNGLFDYLYKVGKTMNASFKYLKNITSIGDSNRETLDR